MSFAAAPAISPSQVTPSLLQSPPIGPERDIALPDIAPTPPPEGVDHIELDVGQIEISGGRPELAAQAEAIKARLSGRRVEIAALYAAATELERAYAGAGFPLMRVTLPPQRLVPGGVVRFAVIDGYIETVDVSGVPERFREFVRARAARLVGKRGVTDAQIERAVLLAGDARGLTIKSTIAAGTEIGGTKLILEGEAKLVTGTVSLDDDLPKTLGTWQSSVSLALNGVFGAGDQEYLLLGTALDRQPRIGLQAPVAIGGFGVSLPVGTNGSTLSADYTRSLTRPQTIPGAPRTVGHFDRATLRADYPWLRSRLETVSLDSSLDYIAQVNVLPQFGTDLDRDRYGAVRLGASWQDTIPSTTTIVVRGQFSQGLGGRGATDSTRIPLSRVGSSPIFTKVNLDGQISQPLSRELVMRVLARGQYTFNAPVFVSEQFALDAADGVSGFPAGSSSVDTGATVRAELTRSLVVAWPALTVSWSPYLFTDVGKGLLVRPTAAESATPIIGSFGLGLRTDVQEGWLKGTGVNVELARRYSNSVNERSGNRLRLGLVHQF